MDLLRGAPDQNLIGQCHHMAYVNHQGGMRSAAVALDVSRIFQCMELHRLALFCVNSRHWELEGGLPDAGSGGVAPTPGRVP